MVERVGGVEVRLSALEKLIKELRSSGRSTWIIAIGAGAAGVTALLLIIAIIATSTGSA